MADNFEFDLLDSSIDTLADYVGFQPFPKGTHKVQFAYELVQSGEKNVPTVKVKFKFLESLEMANKIYDEVTNPNGDVVPEVGKEISINYMMLKKDGTKNTLSEGQLKEILKVTQPVFGGTTIREMLDAASGCELVITFGIRISGEDRDMKNNTIKAIALPE